MDVVLVVGEDDRGTCLLAERGRPVAVSDGTFILEDGHSSVLPRLKRVTSPVDHRQAFREFTCGSPAVEAAADQIGP